MILAVWVILYIPANPSTHAGGFFGNAIADWLGVVMTVWGTKYLFEIGSAESKKVHCKTRRPVPRFLKLHSLSIFLVLTGAGWLYMYLHMDSNSKWGQVVGNIVSEWTQVLGLVILTKKLIERGSKESN